MDLVKLQKLTKLIRYYILTMTTAAGSGHTTSSLSGVELMTALFFGGFFRADLDNPQNPGNDRLIFSKGHASPLFYSLYAAAGKLTVKDLEGYRKFDSPLEGHPTLEFPYTEAPTGSLGQGLPIGLGMALALQRLSPKLLKLSLDSARDRPRSLKDKPKVYVLLGDGEMAEGSVWEAIGAASYHKVDNLVAILDVNRLGQSQPTMLEHDLATYKRRFEAFGWKTAVVKNGHDLKQVSSAFDKIRRHSGERSDSRIDSGQARMTGRPTVVIAKTFKGAGIKILQDKDNWHGKPLSPDLYKQALTDLGKVDLDVRGEVQKPVLSIKYHVSGIKEKKILNTKYVIHNTIYKPGDSIATRQAAGDALTALMYQYKDVVALDGDVKNSLFTESTQRQHPERFFEMFIAEQNMVGAAIGLARRGFIPFVTTFSAFLTRAYDQIRMAALAAANIKFIGSHAGVSIGEDGASQMGLEDLSMFRSVLGSSVLYPADAVSSQKLVEEMIKKDGICYLRVARPTTPVIYDEKEEFPIGRCKVHYFNRHSGERSDSRIISNKKDSGQARMTNKVMIIAAGITLFEALKAQEILSQKNIETIVVDCYSIKPIDAATITKLSNEFPTILTVEDHWFEGGLGDAVLNVFSAKRDVKIYKLAVTRMPHSGKSAELLDFEGISAKAIVSFVRSLQ